MPSATQPILPSQPCLRPDAVVIADAGAPVRIALSARHVVAIDSPPPGLSEWLVSLDGTVPLADASATAPLPPDEALELLGELDRAGLITDASTGLLFRSRESLQSDAVRVAAQARSGAIRRPAPKAAPSRVWVTGCADWARPLSDAVARCGGATCASDESRADLVVVIADAFDHRSRELASRAMAIGIPHVGVEISAVDAVFTPLTIPGRTACRRCWSLQVEEPADDLPARAFAGRLPEPPRLPAHHRALVLALALEHTLCAGEVLSGGLPPDQGEQERYLDLRATAIQNRRVQPHPACGCVGLAA